MMDEKQNHACGNGCGQCGSGICGKCMHTSSLHRLILWAVVCASVFAAGYVIGEAKGRFAAGWRDDYSMNRMHRQMMMQMQGGMMMNGQKMMMPMQGQGMMQNGNGEGMMMNGDGMMMVSGTKR